MIKIHLSRLLGERRMTQKNLSELTGIRANTIGELYNEFAEKLDFEKLDKICEALNCNISELLEYRPNKHRKTGVDLIVDEHGNRRESVGKN